MSQTRRGIKRKACDAENIDQKSNSSESKENKFVGQQEVPLPMADSSLASDSEKDKETSDDSTITPPKKKHRNLWNFRVRQVKVATQETKSAVLVSDSPIQHLSQKQKSEYENFLREIFSNIKSNCNVKVSESSAKGTPRKVATPGGTQLSLKKNYGIVRIYTNDKNLPEFPDVPVLMEVNDEVKKTFEASSPYKNIKQNTYINKVQDITITPELVKASAAEIKKNKGRRKISQQKATVNDGVNEKKGSATQYARKLINRKELKQRVAKYFEWLHSVQHALLATAAQTEANLNVGSFDANTDMMFIEFQHPKLVKAYPNGYSLNVRPEFVRGIEGCQLMTYLHYTIKLDDIVLEFCFNTQTEITPDMFNLDYIEAYFAAAINIKNQKTLVEEKGLPQSPEPSLSSLPDSIPPTSSSNNDIALSPTPLPSSPFHVFFSRQGNKKLRPRTLFQNHPENEMEQDNPQLPEPMQLPAAAMLVS